MERVICLSIGYLFGLFQTAYIYGKIHGIDIRQYGSGNAGTTNTLRVLGTKAGLIVFAGDVLKCVFAVVICSALFGKSHPDMVYLFKIYAAAGAILGHNFPFYLHFKGGKGIAATAGLIPLCVAWVFARIRGIYDPDYGFRADGAVYRYEPAPFDRALCSCLIFNGNGIL